LRGFTHALRRDWRRILLRFLLGLVGASLAWLLIAPAYAWGLAAIARLVAPAIEWSRGTLYEAEGSRVLVRRLVWFGGQTGERDVVYTVWIASGNFGIPMLAALIAATPGLSWARRARAFAWGLGLLTVTQVAFMLVTIEFWQQMPVAAPAGGRLYLPGHTEPRLRVFSALYHFFEIMGRGLFALLAYVSGLALAAPRQRAASAVTRPNAPCPCGSGRKFKRCCGRTAPA
jgi:hypothetical protein